MIHEMTLDSLVAASSRRDRVDLWTCSGFSEATVQVCAERASRRARSVLARWR
jgi:hypothetical protein